MNQLDGQGNFLFLAQGTDDVDRVARIATSAEGRRLTPLQQSNIYVRLAAFDLSPAEIAAKVGKSVEHVRSLLVLGCANNDVQKMVGAGEVSATEAVKLVKQVGDNAGPVLKEKLSEAKAAGKRKVTASVVNSEKKAEKKGGFKSEVQRVELLN